jgi:hypothetical protein
VADAAALLPSRQGPSGAAGADINHWYCCDPDRALCGADVSDEPEIDQDPDCVVCEDLCERPCSPGCDFGL